MEEDGNKGNKYPDKQSEYLMLLQERNRMKKLASGKTKEALANEERERGFSTHFQGANKDKDKDIKPRQAPRPVITINSSARNHIASANLDRFVSVNPKDDNSDAPQRKGWSEPARFILGRKLEISPSVSNRKSNESEVNENRVNLLGEFSNENEKVQTTSADQDSDDDPYADEEFEEIASKIDNPQPAAVADTKPAGSGYVLSSRTFEGGGQPNSTKSIEALVQKAVKSPAYSPRVSLSLAGPTTTSAGAATIRSLSPGAGMMMMSMQRISQASPSSGGVLLLPKSGSTPSVLSLQHPDNVLSADPEVIGMGETPSEASDMDQSLVRHITALPSSQKSILKSLIAKIDSSPVAAQEILQFLNASSNKGSENHCKDLPAANSKPFVGVDIGSPARKSFARPASAAAIAGTAASVPSPKRDKIQTITTNIAMAAVPTTTTAVTKTSKIIDESSGDSTAMPTLGIVPIKIRIRIHSGWDKTKYIAVRAIKLSVESSNGNNTYNDVNILSSCTLELLSGSTVISKTMDWYRSLLDVFTLTRSTAASDSYWKMPIQANKPIEISLSGSFDKSITVGYTSAEEVLKHSKLRIWNYDETNNVMSISPANEIDIFIGTKCIFTGSMPVGNVLPIASSAASMEIFLQSDSLDRTTRPASSRFTKPTTADNKVGSSESVPVATSMTDKDLKLSLTGSASASAFATASAGAGTIPSVPVWLQGVESTSETASITTPSASITVAVAANTRSPSSNIASLAPSLISKRAARRQAPAAPSASHSEYQDNAEKDIPSKLLISKSGDNLNVPNSPSRPNKRSATNSTPFQIRKEDFELRQSLEAIDASDRLNRGRVGAKGGRRAGLNPPSSACSNDVTDVRLSSAAPVVGIESGDEPSEDNTIVRGGRRKSNNSIACISDEPTGVVVSTNAQGNRSGGTSISLAGDRLKQRSQRIDQVQSHVMNALAGLADVMQTLDMQSPATSAVHKTQTQQQQQTYQPQLQRQQQQQQDYARINIVNEPGREDNSNRSKLRYRDYENVDDDGLNGTTTAPAPVPPRRVSTPAAKQNPLRRDFIIEEDDEEDEDDDEDELDDRKQSHDVKLGTSSPYPARSIGDLSLSSELESINRNSIVIDKNFNVPIFPQGKTLLIEILSTWGDEFYVGMNGIEIFDANGDLLWRDNSIADISANPSNINILPEYKNDPRIVSNLINGNNFTCDDLQVWLAPVGCFDLDEGSIELADIPHTKEEMTSIIATVTITFTRTVHISMLRLFNYNKSRTHTARGIRTCRIFLDNLEIFQGEIREAPGILSTADAASEVVLFTDEYTILQNIARYHAKCSYYPDCKSLDDIVAGIKASHFSCRPRSSDTILDSPITRSITTINPVLSAGVARPSTSVASAATSQGIMTVSSLVSYDNSVAVAGGVPAVDINTMKSLQSIPTQNLRSRPQLQSASEVEAAVQDRPDELENSMQLSASFRSLLTESKINGLALTGIRSNAGIADESFGQSSSQTGDMLSDKDLVVCRKIRINIDRTQGDGYYVGLCRLQVLAGTQCSIIDPSEFRLSAEPTDMSAIGCFDDPRVLKNLTNGCNNISNDRLMWLVPFTFGSNHFLDISFNKPCKVAGIRFWNYNKGVHCSGAWEEDILRGVREISLSADSLLLGSWQLRLGPGCDGVSFGQTVLMRDVCRGSSATCPGIAFADGSHGSSLIRYVTPSVKQDYETPIHPAGMMWRLVFHDNWNDGYYIGLDAIKFIDITGKILDLQVARASITAVPHSLRDLSDELAEDPRTPEALFSPLNSAGLYSRNAGPSSQVDTVDASCWLAPLSRCMTDEERNRSAQRLASNSWTSKPTRGALADVVTESYKFPLDNTLFVLFDYPVALAAIRIYNYSKTPARGVRDMSIYVDSRLVYMGSLLPSDRELLIDSVSRKPGADKVRAGQSVLFTKDPTIIRAEKERVPYCGGFEQDVLCIDEKQVIIRSRGMFDPPNAAAEGIVTNLQNRPSTSANRY